MAEISAPVSRRPIGLALLALAGLAVLFYTSYGFANWAASRREGVGSVVFGWEHRIPFLAWTILPYWTTNLFYAGSVLLARSRDELKTQVLRLLAVQLIAIACFLAFPLRFAWTRPETSGLFGFAFEVLGGFDKPYNQAPSLHVALTVVLWAFYARLLSRPLAIAFGAWSVLVIVSVLTTWQHHFIDIPTGLLLGLLVVWALPFESASPLAGWRRTLDLARLTIALWWGLASLICCGLAAWIGGWALWLLWPAVSFAMVALAYWRGGPGFFGKQANGRMPPAAILLLAPYLCIAWLNSRAWTRRDVPEVEILPGVALGRFPSPADPPRFATVIDLAAELPRLIEAPAWHSFPMLDLVAPEPATLRAAADAIVEAEHRGPVRVNCALGYGRSVCALAVFLVRSGKVADLDAAVALLRRQRPRMHMRPGQVAAVREAIDEPG